MYVSIKICPFISVMHSTFSYWEKKRRKKGFKTPEKMISIVDQWKLITQAGISSITWICVCQFEKT